MLAIAPLAATALLVLALLALSIVDIRERRIPDAISLPLMAAGLGWTAFAAPHDLLSHALAAAAGFAAFWAVAIGFRRLRGYDGLGLGDAKLMAAAGAWLGPLALAPITLIGALSALGTIGLLHGTGRPQTLTSALPFGPFLSLGILTLWLMDLAA